MDAHGFDTLTRAVTTAISRRRGLLGLAGAALAFVAGPAAPASVAAARPGGICHALGHACNDGQVPCCGKAVCQNRRCQCRGRRTACGKRCVDTRRHNQHCGRCGRRCGKGEQCRNGKCQDPNDGGGGGLGDSRCDTILTKAGCQRLGGTGPYRCPAQTDLTNQNLSGCDLSGARIESEVAFTGATLDDVNFSRADMLNADFREASMLRVNLAGAVMSGVDFSGANMRAASFLGAELGFTSFMELTDLQGADFTNAAVTRTDMSQANLEGARVQGADFWIGWSDTTCPNGENSNDHGNSCCGQFGGDIVRDCDDWNGIN